eukprot:TRINITY_DN1022_c0_g3_i1.p1 TRINITY_DN1022_c0_g3~~TRINITY_DN1022_c0_g3_i1.p1  ORF type:complete len:111 (-),score=31.14 TRINITY_DN1022_c0_g3_i1:12-344(-)
MNLHNQVLFPTFTLSPFNFSSISFKLPSTFLQLFFNFSSLIFIVKLTHQTAITTTLTALNQNKFHFHSLSLFLSFSLSLSFTSSSLFLSPVLCVDTVSYTHLTLPTICSV